MRPLLQYFTRHGFVGFDGGRVGKEQGRKGKGGKSTHQGRKATCSRVFHITFFSRFFVHWRRDMVHTQDEVGRKGKRKSKARDKQQEWGDEGVGADLKIRGVSRGLVLCLGRFFFLVL